VAALDLPLTAHDSSPTMSVNYDDPMFRLFLYQRYLMIQARRNQPEYPFPDGAEQQRYLPPQLLYEPTSPGVSTPSFDPIPIPNSHQLSPSPRSSVWPLSAATSPLGYSIALDGSEQNAFESDPTTILYTPAASNEPKSQNNGQAISPRRTQQLVSAQESGQLNQNGNSSRDRTRCRKSMKGGSGCQDSNSDSSSISTPPIGGDSSTNQASINPNMFADIQDRPFCCGTCPWQFARKRDRDRHERSVHTREGRYRCVACQQGFVRSDARQRHWKKVPLCQEQHNLLEAPAFRGRQREI